MSARTNLMTIGHKKGKELLFYGRETNPAKESEDCMFSHPPEVAPLNATARHLRWSGGCTWGLFHEAKIVVYIYIYISIYSSMYIYIYT